MRETVVGLLNKADLRILGSEGSRQGLNLSLQHEEGLFIDILALTLGLSQPCKEKVVLVSHLDELTFKVDAYLLNFPHFGVLKHKEGLTLSEVLLFKTVVLAGQVGKTVDLLLLPAYYFPQILRLPRLIMR
jgi:hypothetical protein